MFCTAGSSGLPIYERKHYNVRCFGKNKVLQHNLKIKCFRQLVYHTYERYVKTITFSRSCIILTFEDWCIRCENSARDVAVSVLTKLT